MEKTPLVRTQLGGCLLQVPSPTFFPFLPLLPGSSNETRRPGTLLPQGPGTVPCSIAQCAFSMTLVFPTCPSARGRFCCLVCFLGLVSWKSTNKTVLKRNHCQLTPCGESVYRTCPKGQLDGTEGTKLGVGMVEQAVLEEPSHKETGQRQSLTTSDNRSLELGGACSHGGCSRDLVRP